VPRALTTGAAQSAHHTTLPLGHTYMRNDWFHGRLREAIKNLLAYCMPQLLQNIFDAFSIGKGTNKDKTQEVDLVVIQRLYDWESLAKEHCNTFADVANSNRWVRDRCFQTLR
jgi:hypothetical protein